MKNFFLGVIVASILGGLFLLNPSKEDFAERYAAKLNGQLGDELGLSSDNAVGDFFGGLSEALIEEYLKSEVQQSNYLLATVFEVPMPEKDLRVLGLAGQYISLN